MGGLELTVTPSEVDPGLEEKKALDEKGYVVIEDVLSNEECQHFKALLERDHRRYASLHCDSADTDHGLNDKSREKVVYNLHNKDLDYWRLFDDAKVLGLIGPALRAGSYQSSEDFHLLNISARCPLRGARGQQLHLDSNLPGRDAYPLIMVALFMLDDFFRGNGATRIVPGSHRGSTYAENGKRYDQEVLVEGRRGSVLIFNGALWHGGSDKSDDSDRWAVILGYGRWFIKPSFDFSRNTPAAVYSRLSSAQKKLIGLHSQPPKDEFSRITRRSDEPEWRPGYALPPCQKGEYPE